MLMLFDHPALRGCHRSAAEKFRHSHGGVALAGITPQRYSEDAFERSLPSADDSASPA
jgi:hypothetical protein